MEEVIKIEFEEDGICESIGKFAFYGNQGTVATELLYSTYNSYFPEVCEKFSKQDRESFNNNPNVRRESNSGLYDVYCGEKAYDKINIEKDEAK